MTSEKSNCSTLATNSSTALRNITSTVHPPNDVPYRSHSNGGIIAGILVPVLLIITSVAVLIILFRKEIWRPQFLTNIIEKIHTEDDIVSDTGWFGTRFGRRHSSKVPIQRNEVRQYATVEGDFEHAFCQTIDERRPDDSQDISYTLSEDSQYDELNKSHMRRVVDSSNSEMYEHAHHLPPDLAKDYDSADANALFPKRFQFERPVSDSHNTYSHMPMNQQDISEQDGNESNQFDNSEVETGNDSFYDNNKTHEPITQFNATDENS